MEQFIRDIERYTEAQGITPQVFLRRLLNAEWGRWERWLSRQASPRMETVERVRAYMRAHPPSDTSGDAP